MVEKIKNICVGSDHAGFELKEVIIQKLKSKGMIVKDFGTNSPDSVDYPDFVHPLAEAVESGEFKFGIITCGSGNGVNMVANKYNGIRSALCWNSEIAELARLHNDANIVAIPARFISEDEALKIVDIFLNTEFEGGRHQKRVDKISKTI
ncbi:MAG: ribose 5-phosphate isomerase B [Bacteroidetes bacterium]|nr:ribose 5-phosphate isomerase B [Bacteroidota bacterium]